jgi:hypothetical protein
MINVLEVLLVENLRYPAPSYVWNSGQREKNIWITNRSVKLSAHLRNFRRWHRVILLPRKPRIRPLILIDRS